MNYTEAAQFISNDLRLKTLPLGVKFLKQKSGFPEKTRQPSVALGKRITICQAVTMARAYGWTMGIAKEDVICVPGMLAFGFSRASEPRSTLGKLFCEIGFSEDVEGARTETGSMSFLDRGAYEAIVFAPLEKGLFAPDTVVIHGNPAQVMRMVQAFAFSKGTRVTGNFGGKVECSEYLIAPFISGAPRVAIPGNGDRIFSMTQDEEMVLAFPGAGLENLVEGLKQAGKKIGARYPITFYQNFQPEFPKIYKSMGQELGDF